MEPKVVTIEEVLEEYKTMITNWANSYLKLATSKPGDKCLYEDFWSEIEEFLMPKLTRHLTCKHVDYAKFQEFHGWLVTKYEELVKAIEAVEPKVVDEKVDEVMKMGLTDEQKAKLIESWGMKKCRCKEKVDGS